MLTFVIVGAVAGGLVGSLAFGVPRGPAFGVVLGLILGLAPVALSESDAQPQHTNLRLRGRSWESARTLAAALAIGITVGLVFGPGAGLAIGLAVGLVYLVRSADLAARSLSPTSSYRGDRRQATAQVIAFGLVFGSAAGLAFGLSAGPAIGLLAGLVLGLLAGLAIGLADAAWFQFVSSALGVSLRWPSRLPAPWRVMPMLQDCHRLGLLRTVGPVYQFRHAELQDHLVPPTAGSDAGGSSTER